MKKIKMVVLTAVTIILFLALNMNVLSAEERAGSKDESKEFTLEEITVTAERRETQVQKMPVSVVALSNNDLKENGITDVSDLPALVPSLSFQNNGNGNFLNVRGVGLTEAAPGQTNGVAVHIDGAYVAKELTIDDAFFDLERIEVLRGPQGTYVGQNSTGGAMFLVTRSPNMEKAEGYGSITIGDYNHRVFEGAVSAPVSDKLAFRFSFQAENRDSFTTNYGKFGPGTKPETSNDPGKIDRHIARIQFKYQPSDKFDVRVIYQNSYLSTDNLPFRVDNAVTRANPWKASFDIEQKRLRKYDRYTAIANMQVTDGIQARLTAAYQKMDNDLLSDDDHTSPYVSTGTPQAYKQVHIRDEYTTAELDLLSTTDNRFQWVAGAELLDYTSPFTFQSIPYAVTPDYDTGLTLDFTNFRKNYAIFGEGTYNFTPSLELKVGARYNKDETGLKEGSWLAFSPRGPRLPLSVNANSEEWTGRVLLNWTPMDNNTFYLTISRGYKPGGWEAFGTTYKQEIVLNKEIGWKSNLFDRHLLTSLSLFHMDYDGYQASVATDPSDPTKTVTHNIDGTKIMGVDFQLQALIDRMEFGLNGTLMDTKYGEIELFEPANTGGPGIPAVPTPVNLKDRQLSYAPDLSGNIYLKYNFELSSGASLTPRIDWRYTAAQWTSFYHEANAKLNSMSYGDIRLRYDPNANWYIEGYVSNFTNELYESFRSNYGIMYGPPRQVGVTVQYKF